MLFALRSEASFSILRLSVAYQIAAAIIPRSGTPLGLKPRSVVLLSRERAESTNKAADCVFVYWHVGRPERSERSSQFALLWQGRHRIAKAKFDKAHLFVGRDLTRSFDAKEF